ncbi:MAG TPA: TonB-dependent receptor [Steroidobacteraceae bacterium]|nr:TonB-dependent receptor [Steroidobacteraceae bacterium]
MKTFKTLDLTRPAGRRSALAISSTATGCALLLLAASGSAGAADQPGDTATAQAPLEEVVVTGVRAAIESAIAVKRNSGSIVEAVSAEDIGKLPDTSIAESISRLPGLTSQRANGRASAISLRGTDPAFTNALLNGREQVSTGDNRSIEFDQYPSELLSGVTVYKTPDAQLIGQGLAGTIDMQTIRPLEYGKSAVAFNARREYNSHNDLGANSTNKGYRFSLSFIDQFADNTLGVALGVARLDSPLATQGVGTYEPWHLNGTEHAGVPADVYVTDGMKIRTDMGENIRDGALATIEWRPNASFTSTFDAYYTKSDETDDARSLEWNLGNYPATTDYSNLVISDGTLVGATVANVRPLARNFQFITNDKITALGWNNKWSAGAWTLTGDLSYSKATRDQFQPETNAQWGTCANGGDPACLDTAQIQLNGTSSMPSASFGLNYADPTRVAFGPTIYGAGYVKKPHVEDKLKSIRIDLSHDGAGWFEKFSGGVNYSDRTKDKSSPETGLNTLASGAVSIAPQYLYSATNLYYGGPVNALAWNVPAVLAAYYQPIVYGTPTTPGYSYLVGKWWSVEEKILTASLRGNLDHELSPNVTLRGNIGVQIINTDQSSDSFSINDANGGAVTPATAGKKYTDVLPQINLAFVLPEQQTVRVGLAREVARPRMDQLKASIEEGASQITGIPGGSAGNPLLDPWRADAFDLSYEKYFNNKAYLSAAVFYKNLKSYIFDTTNQSYDFSAFLSTLPAGYFGNVTPQSIGALSQPLNGKGGKLQGIELSLSLPGEMLADSLNGFGAVLSVSETDSNIKIFDPPSGSNSIISTTGLGEITLPGLSKTVWNATLYYEKQGFAARVATRARSKYIGEITNFANDRSFRFVKGDTITDFQTSYEFQSGRMRGIQLLFQINNLTDAPYVAYVQSEQRILDYQTYGRQMLLGFNYKF